ncbi:MAG: NUDIX domain-containing protein [Chlamydiota bacterium]
MQEKNAQKQSVSGIVFDAKRESVLLIKRRDIPVWVLPGGGLDPNETPEQGVIREETGYHVAIVRKSAEYLPVNKMTFLTHAYECRIMDGSAHCGDETLDVQFFPLHSLPKLPPPYQGWIEDAAANHPAMLRKEIEGVSYWILLKLFLQHPLLVGRYLLTKLGIHLNRRD